MTQKIGFKALVLFLTGFLVMSGRAMAQQTAKIKGRLVNSNSGDPIGGLTVYTRGTGLHTVSDSLGNFILGNVPYGITIVSINGDFVNATDITVSVDSPVLDLNTIRIYVGNVAFAEDATGIPTITESADGSGASENGEGAAVYAQGNNKGIKDFYAGTLTNLSIYDNYQPRGMRRNTREVEINGMPMNDAETGLASYAQMGSGGLGDVFRNHHSSYGLAPSDFTFGGLAGSIYYQATAADQRAGTQVTYTNSNRTYRNGVMVTENTGMMKNGWAFSASFSGRWAKEGYYPGTFYDGKAYYLAASKKLGKGILNLTTFGSPTVRGKTAAATMEAFSLAGTNYYNHNWGYQNGQIRNASVQDVFQPVTVINYDCRPSDRTKWNTALGYEFGKDMNSGLFSYNGSSNVIGDYYRNLPNYYYTMVPPDSIDGNAVKAYLKSHPQKMLLDWNSLYNSNYGNVQTINNVGGVAGKSVTGLQSIYVLSNRVSDLSKFSFNTALDHTVNQNIEVFGGVSYVVQNTEFYNQLSDLLGGNFFVDNNQFAPTTAVPNPNANYNNARDPNAVIKVGDKWDYDYSIRVNTASAWGQTKIAWHRFNIFLAAQVGNCAFYRDGYFQYGVFMNNSYGKSATHNFLTTGFKGGVDFNIDRKNVLFLNAGYTTTPPSFDNTYISAPTRDFVVSNPTVQTNRSLEAGYFYNTPKLKFGAVGYVNDETNVTTIQRFFNDDPSVYTFVNYVMQGIGTRSTGVEISLDGKIVNAFGFTASAFVGQSFFTTNPTSSMYLDNDTTLHPVPSQTYIKNYYLAVGPQSVYSAGLTYRPRKWNFAINGHYLDRNYVSINPNRRTQAAGGFYSAGSPQWHAIFDQEKLPSVFTMDLHTGYSWDMTRAITGVFKKVHHNTTMNVNLGIYNLLNNTNIINSGYEQLRFDFTNYQTARFANKYTYGMGTNYMLNVSFRF